MEASVGYQVLRHARRYVPELRRRTDFVKKIDQFDDRISTGELTFDDIVEAIENCNPEYRGKPVSVARIEQCKQIIKDHFAALLKPKRVTETLRVLLALLKSQPNTGSWYESERAFGPEEQPERTGFGYNRPRVRVDIPRKEYEYDPDDDDNEFYIKLSAEVFVKKRGYWTRPSYMMFLNFTKDGFPHPINPDDGHDVMETHRMSQIISAIVNNPDLVESNLTEVYVPKSENSYKKANLATWAGDAVASSCLFSIERIVHQHSAFIDLSV